MSVQLTLNVLLIRFVQGRDIVEKLLLRLKSAINRIKYMRNVTYLYQRYLKNGVYYFALGNKELVFNINVSVQ